MGVADSHGNGPRPKVTVELRGSGVSGSGVKWQLLGFAGSYCFGDELVPARDGLARWALDGSDGAADLACEDRCEAVARPSRHLPYGTSYRHMCMDGCGDKCIEMCWDMCHMWLRMPTRPNSA